MPKTIAQWLLALPNTISAVDGTLTIGGKDYVAAKYDKQMTPPEGARNPAPYVQTMIYAIGEHPLVGRRRKLACFTMQGDTNEWYVSGYATKRAITPQNSEFHPFGESFMIAPWNVGGKVDDGERTVYERVPASFTPPRSRTS